MKTILTVLLCIPLLCFGQVTDKDKQDLENALKTEINKELDDIKSKITKLQNEVLNNPNLAEDAKKQIETEVKSQLDELKASYKKVKKLAKEGKLTDEVKKQFQAQIKQTEKELKQDQKEIKKAIKEAEKLSKSKEK